MSEYDPALDDECTKAFESWRRSTAQIHPDDAVALDGFTDGYANRGTRSMHIGWKAAWKEAKKRFSTKNEADAMRKALADVIYLATDPKEFQYLDRGIGTSTAKGKALLNARALLSKAGGQPSCLREGE